MNHSALPGSASRIKNAPRPPPIHAPKIGTSAVTATNAETAPAYGIPRISIPKKHRTPMITASVSCPLTKFVKVWFVRAAMLRSRCAFFCGKTVTMSFFKCAAMTSFFASRYSAKTRPKRTSTKTDRTEVAAPHVTVRMPLSSSLIKVVTFSINRSEFMAYSGRIMLYFAANWTTPAHHRPIFST